MPENDQKTPDTSNWPDAAGRTAGEFTKPVDTQLTHINRIVIALVAMSVFLCFTFAFIEDLRYLIPWLIGIAVVAAGVGFGLVPLAWRTGNSHRFNAQPVTSEGLVKLESQERERVHLGDTEWREWEQSRGVVLLIKLTEEERKQLFEKMMAAPNAALPRLSAASVTTPLLATTEPVADETPAPQGEDGEEEE